MPETSLPWRARLRRALAHPRTAMATKAAIAATLAWMLALQLPGAAQDYPYYAPLGALTAMYPTVASSLRESLQSVASILLGAGIALLVDAVLDPGALVIAVVVGVGILVGGFRWLGSQRVYVPTAALFVLVLGGQDDYTFAASFAGLFLLGAALSVLVNAVWPALPLPEADHALARLRDALQDHLRHLAARLVPGDEDDGGDGTPVGPGLTTLTSRAREVVKETDEAARGNYRARRHPGAVDTRWDAFRTLERVVLLVDDISGLLDDRPWGQDLHQAPRDLREPLAQGLDALADAVHDVGLRPTAPEARTQVETAVDDLGRAIRARGPEAADDPEVLVMSTVVTTLRRCVSAMSPPDDADER